jgi:transcriptional repressor NrdR
VRCPWCASIDDKVVDSRSADEGVAIRRRRECLGCGKRFTTYERLDDLPLVVLKRSGDRMHFDRNKIMVGLKSAAKNLPVSIEQLESIASEVEEELRLEGPEISSEMIGVAVLDRLRRVDGVAYLRFASVYKNFTDPADFAREAKMLKKSTAPKSISGSAMSSAENSSVELPAPSE